MTNQLLAKLEMANRKIDKYKEVLVLELLEEIKWLIEKLNLDVGMIIKCTK